MVAGLGLALHGINHIDAPVIPGIPALWMAGLSIVFKETLYQYSSRIAKRNSSRILLANAWHHRTDAISSIVALIGIAGALRGYPIADPIAAILVSGWILKTGITIGYGSVKELTDIQVEQDVILSIHEVLRNVAGVEHYHQIRARRMGPYILVDLHIEVRNEISISVGHQISERVRHAILKEIPSVNEVLVHIDIENDQEEESLTLMRPQKEVEKDVRQILAEIPEVKSMTHFMCHYLDEEMTVQVTIIMEPGLYVYEAQAIAEKARDLIEQIQDIHSADIHLEFKEHSG
jgi:divalent metal cation (Fe/Co/Zn/Cd) transporter